MDFDKMTGPQLVAAYNEMVLTAVDLGIKATATKRFGDLAAARKRCSLLHTTIQARKAPQAAAECKIDHTSEGTIPIELCRTCNPELNHKTKTKTTRPVAARPATAEDLAWRLGLPASMSDEEAREVLARRKAKKSEATQDRIAKMKETKAAKDAAQLESVNLKRKEKGMEPLTTLTQTEATMAKKAKKKSNGRFDDDATITKLTKENAGRKGTHSYNLFEKIKTGMTIADWKKIAKERAGNYLRWYVSHGFVKVS